MNDYQILAWIVVAGAIALAVFARYDHNKRVSDKAIDKEASK